MINKVLTVDIIMCYNLSTLNIPLELHFQISLLLGTIIRKIPLPIATSSIGEETESMAMDQLMPMSDAVLDVNQLEVIGNHFLEVLLKMKHNGAIDKTRAGFTALCNRLLCSDDSRFVALQLLYLNYVFLHGDLSSEVVFITAIQTKKFHGKDVLPYVT